MSQFLSESTLEAPTKTEKDRADAPIRRKESNSSVADRAAQVRAARAVQAKGGTNQGQQDVRQLATNGTSGSGGALPHAQRIQASFGTHDISGVTAHTGAEAQQATTAMGAQAYATGNQVAFNTESPDLHTAAHEAAHVVQQRGGVQLKGGVGQEGDTYERNADAVADAVVAGESAQGLLDSVAGDRTQTAASEHAIQKRDDPKPKKEASGAAMTRLALCQKAIEHTKSVFEFGAGNQIPALRATNMNSNYRLQVMRNLAYWELAPSVYDLALANRAALTAAMADIAKGGNCGEHATVAFDYLRVTAPGQRIQKAQKDGFDHAFVLMGDLSADTDADITVSDPWPTHPHATLWEDHFAHTADRAKILDHGSMVADGQNVKKVIASGLKLKPEGVAMLKKADSDERTEERIEKDKKWFWNHRSSAKKGHDFEYVEREEEVEDSPAVASDERGR